MPFYENLYYFIQYAIYVLYGLLFLNIWDNAPEYLSIFNNFLQVFIALVLMYFFNPLFNKNIKFNDFHRSVAFSAGLFIFTTTSISVFIQNIQRIVVFIRRLFGL